MKNIVTGIYQIKHIASGKIYIGSATNIYKRWNFHKETLRNKTHHNGRLQNAWNKYGEEAFEFSIIETCFIFALIFREQHYMDALKPFYNIAKVAGSALGVKHTDETRAKMSAIMKGRVMTEEHKRNLSIAGKGRVFTKEHLENMSKANIGKKRSDADKAKMAERMKGNTRALGNQFTDEQKKIVSDGLKKARENGKIFGYTGMKHTDETKSKISAANKGKERTPESRARYSVAMLLRWARKKAKEPQ